ncbi:hypothetical protein [Palleronia pelagia]|uniref:Uncharacterized protein n=1 Tax=Palleronia pelagia TaxID=387096 RepID=A0A1H8JY17_9RHOB|nr:hypothetical protein [Palleronia pelagia]SEN85590.1 hypothetical protein SAMN04488011_10710 [Palleronia pelagia]
MQSLIIGGAIVALLGLLGLVYCIVAALKARRAGLSDDALRARLQRLVAWNLGSLMLSMIGLGMVVAGIFLG